MIIINATNTSNAASAGRTLRKRLDMMARAKHKGPLAAAICTAQESIHIRDKVLGTQTFDTAYERGKQFRNVAVRTLGTITDRSGTVGRHMTNEVVQGYGELDKKQEVKRQEEIERFGGPPTFIEQVAEGLNELEKLPPLSRRRLLFSGPKEYATEAAASVAAFTLPWPFNRLASLYRYLNPKKKNI